MHPERIGTLYVRTSGSQSSDTRRTIDGEQWERVRDDVHSLLSLLFSAMRTSGANFRAGAVVRYLQAGRVSADYFDVLAIHPVIGRNFAQAEDRPQGPRTAILSYALWQTAFAGNPNVVGQTVLLKSRSHTIIGVLPERATTPLNADIYTALQPGRTGEGQAANFVAIARLRDGATWQQADAELNQALSRTTRTLRLARTDPWCAPDLSLRAVAEGRYRYPPTSGVGPRPRGRIHLAHCLRQHRGAHPGAYAAAHS